MRHFSNKQSTVYTPTGNTLRGTLRESAPNPTLKPSNSANTTSNSPSNSNRSTTSPSPSVTSSSSSSTAAVKAKFESNASSPSTPSENNGTLRDQRKGQTWNSPQKVATGTGNGNGNTNTFRQSSLASLPTTNTMNAAAKNTASGDANTTSTKASSPVAQPKASVPVKPVNVDPNQDDAARSKPLNKPKPRQSVRLTDLVLKEEPKIEKPEPRGSFQISEKWKIKYDELEFADLVSSGSAGEVYLGYYFGTPVAIKKLFALADDEKHLVEREYIMLTEVNHPNLVQFLGLCDHESGIYLITEYVEHGDLFDLLVFGDKKLDWKNKVKLALQIAQAVYYLHSRGIIHRDLKSQNVLIGENYKVKLCDLGLATLLENNKRTTICGTNEWMAPEIMIQNSYDSKVDVFSFGIVMQELITNAPPPKREISKMLAFDVDKFKKSLPRDCPEGFAQLVINCCKFKPEERPGFKDVVASLRKLHDSLDN